MRRVAVRPVVRLAFMARVFSCSVFSALNHRRAVLP
jgi:hypothetical protein